MKNLTTFLFLLLLAASPVTAQTRYHVTTTGSDGASGLDWANALLTISNAVAKATAAGDSVVVSNGTYSISTEIVITNTITVESTNGWQVTTVRRAGPGYHRIFYCANDNAVVDGFTIREGLETADHGGGVYMTGGTLLNCNVFSNSAYGANKGGGGIYVTGNSTISNCVINANRGFHYSGGIYIASGGPTVRNCIISNNYALVWGGGIYMVDGTVENCLIVHNWLSGNNVQYFGGGVRINAGLLLNCTIADNWTKEATRAAGVWRTGGAITNCIIYNNTMGVYAEDINGTIANFGYCNSPELSGSGNISELPDFIDRSSGNYRLRLSSPCIDSGTNLLAFDLDGTARPIDGYDSGVPISDIGCYEAPAMTNDPFRCGFTASTNTGMSSLEVVFTAYVGGANTNSLYYEWDFEYDGTNDVVGQGHAVVTNTYTFGVFTVSLYVSNAINDVASFVRTDYIRVAASTVYVDMNGSHTPPYDTWSKAATNLADAVLVTADGMAVYVTNGTYVVREVSISDAVTIQSMNGASVTIFSNPGGGDRILDVTHSNAVIDGFTLTGADLSALSGAAAQLNGGTIKNCIVSNNAAASSSQGGAIYMRGDSRVESCLIADNEGFHYSGGIYMNSANAVVEDCIISNNYAYVFGAGIYMVNGTVRNCLVVTNYITGNHSTYGGGGMFMTSPSFLLTRKCNV